MKLHLPRALAAAVMALFAIPNALAETVTITMGGNQYEGTTVLSTEVETAPSEGEYVFFNRGLNQDYTVSSSTNWVCSTAKTLIMGNATYVDPNTSETVTCPTSRLYVNAASGTLTVGANLILGSAEDENADALRLKGNGANSAVINGPISVVNYGARIWNEAGTNYMQGAILAEGKTIKVVGGTTSAVLRLAGGGTIGTLNLAQAGGSVTLSATNQSGTTAASKEYTITTLNSENSSAALTVESGVTLNLTNLTEGKLINEGTLNLGGTGISSTLAVQGLSNVGILNILNDTAVNLDLTEYAGTHIGSAVTTTVEGEGGTVTKPANGFGKISSFELSSLIAGTVNVGFGVSWTEGQNELTYSNGVLSYGTDQSLTSTIYQINDAEAGYNLTGATSVVIGATNGTVSLTGATSLDITVKQGAILDIKGNECEGCDLVLAGGTLKNSGAATDARHQQFFSLTLTADSEIQVGSDRNQYGIIRQDFGSTFIDLGGHTLTKTGDGNFFAATANLRGGGILKIQGGTFTIGLSEGGEKASIGNSSDTENTNIWFTGNGRLNSGKGINLNKDVEFLAKAEAASAEDVSTAGVTGTISAALDLKNKTATFKAAEANDKLVISGLISDSTSNDTNPKVRVTGKGTVEFAAGSGGGKVMNLTLSADSTLLCNAGADRVLKFNCSNFAGSLSIDSGEVQSINTNGGDIDHVTISSLLIKEGATMNLTATYKEHVFVSGALSGGGNLVTSYAIGTSNSTQTDGYRATVISGDAEDFTGIWELTAKGETSANRRVYGVLNTNDGKFGGVVKFTGTNNVVTAAAGSQLLLAKDSSIAGLQSDAGLTNAVVKGVNYTSSTTDATLRGNFDSVERQLTIAGNENQSFSGQIDSRVSLIVGDGTNAASQTFDGATVGGSMELKKQATVTATGNTTIATLTGTGTLTTSGASVTDGSAFTGTLEATGSALTVNGGVGSKMAALKANGGDITIFSATSVEVQEIVLGAGNTLSTYTKTSAGEETLLFLNGTADAPATLEADAGATLNANLSVSNATITLNGGALQMGSYLMMGSGNTLSGIDLSSAWQENSITLFTGVDSFNDSTVAASVAASSIFSNSALVDGAGGYNYKVLYGGGENAVVELVRTASDTPEPTTATLSLLALMGLAARRRRKAAK